MGLGYLLKEAEYYKHLDGGLKRIGIKYLFAKTPLKKLVNTGIYNFIYSGLMKRKTKKFSPYMLHIENTNICNATCIMCPHVKMKRSKKIMSQADFEKIIENIAPFANIKYVAVTGFGEPLADKEIINKIKYLNKMHPEYQINIYTNASLMTEKISDELLKLNILKINFSINGSRNTYKKIMGLDYNKSVKNILYFLKKKKELGKKFPLTNVSAMLIKDNKEDINEFKKYWEQKVDSVMLYLPSDWVGSIDEGILDKVPFKEKRWACATLWRTISIDVKGNVIMCCRDYESKVVLGNLLKQNIKQIWESEKFKELLKKQANLDFCMPVCSRCNNVFDSSLDWWN